MSEEKKLFSELDFMGRFHAYGDDGYGNARYYHQLKASLCEKFLSKYAGPEKTFLDAGAGRGPYSFMASKKYGLIYCFEYNEKELEAAKVNIGDNQKVIFKQVDLTNIPLPDQSVDVIICSEVLEHIPNHQQAAKELFRVLKTGGNMLFSMPNRRSLFYWKVKRVNHVLAAKDARDVLPNEWEAWRHFQFSPKDIKKIANEAGFIINKSYGANLAPLPHGLRKFMMQKTPYLFGLFITLQSHLSRLLGRYCSFYFLELKK